MVTVIIKIIQFYRKFISPLFLNLFGGSCRFAPTCSEYAIEAFSKYGLIRGLGLSFRRVAKCHPFSQSGYDPLPIK